MKKARKRFPFPLRGRGAIALFLAAWALSCGASKDPRYFHTYMQSDPGKLDPFYSTDVISGRVLTMLCNGLFAVDNAGKLICDLADSYSFDGRKLDVRLKRGVLFHDGSELTSDDVVFSFDRIRNSSNPTSPRRWMFASVRNIRGKGRYGVEIVLDRPRATFPYLLTMPGSYIVSRNSDFDSGKLIGTGPFYLARWLQDEKLLLLRNEKYFGGRPGVEGIEFRIIPEDLSARFEFINGTLDYFEMPFLVNPGFGEGKARVVDIPELSVHYIALNTARAPFSDRRFRTALNMAVDKSAVRTGLFGGRFRDAGGPVPPGTGGYEPPGGAIPFDPEKARREVEALGLGGYHITLLVKADHQAALAGQLIQHFLMEAGLRVSLRPVEWSALKARVVKGDFDMAYFTWHADYPEPENFLYPLFHSGNAGAGGNRSFFSSGRVDRLLEKAQGTLDREKRFDIYRSAEGIIISEAPWIFLWYGDKRIALSRRVSGFEPYPIFTVFKGDRIRLE